MRLLSKVRQPDRSKEHPFSIRILSLDGGGIYGLTEALWLRKLCEQCDNFLDGTDVDMFAGCSSGAINALLLARYERPREAVLGGVLESFWMDAGTFTNTDPLGAWLSLYGLTPWFSEKDFLSQLERHFGNDTFRELKQNVLISAYNWTGGSASFNETGPRMPWPLSMAMPEVQSRGMPGGESWGPMYFQNYKGDQEAIREARRWLTSEEQPVWEAHEKRLLERLRGTLREDPCLDYRVADIAYGAATPPGFRKIRGGIGDGASFTANPAVAAIADSPWIMASRINGRALTQMAMMEQLRAQGASEGSARFLRDNLEKLDAMKGDIARMGELLQHISVMSIGSGQYMPAYWLRDIDLGFLTFQNMPTNPGLGVWYPPQAYALDPAVKGDEYVCWSLLYDRFFRLNPSVLSLPTVTAAYLARFPMLKEWLVSQIQAAVNSTASLQALQGALQFLSRGWQDAPHPDGRSGGRRHPMDGLNRTRAAIDRVKKDLTNVPDSHKEVARNTTRLAITQTLEEIKKAMQEGGEQKVKERIAEVEKELEESIDEIFEEAFEATKSETPKEG